MNILAFLQAPSSKPDPLLAGLHGDYRSNPEHTHNYTNVSQEAGVLTT